MRQYLIHQILLEFRLLNHNKHRQYFRFSFLVIYQSLKRRELNLPKNNLNLSRFV